MRRFHVLLTVLAVSAAGILAMQGVQAQDRFAATQPSSKVAVCNLTEVFSQYIMAREMAQTMSQEQKKVAIEDDKRGKAIGDMEAMLEALKPGSNEYEKRVLELIKARADRQTIAQIENIRLQREYNRKTVEIYAKISSVVADVATEMGFAIVLQIQPQDISTAGAADPARAINMRQVLYNHPAVDITHQVVAKLNAGPVGGRAN